MPKFKAFVILDVDVDPKCVDKSSFAAAVAAEFAREAIAQQGYAVEVHQLDEHGQPRPGTPFISYPHSPMRDRRVTDRVRARSSAAAAAHNENALLAKDC
jgi:hypothetical protein